MDDWKNNLTPKQLETVSQLREKVADVLQPHHDDFFLWRWLKARKYDVTKAEQMLRNSLEWRANYRADRILHEFRPPEVLLKYYPGGVFGVDKEGHPILWQLSNNFDAPGVMKSVKKSDLVKFHVWRMEKVMKMCEEETQKRGKRIHNSLHISDLDGLALSQVFSGGISDAMKQVFAIFEANYPENLHSSYVINAPGIFPVIYNILRPFLSEDTKNKVHILGRNWQDELYKVIDREELPVHWGGTQRQPDDHCSDHITQAGKVPESYFLSDKLTGVEREEMKTLTVVRGNVFNLYQDVASAGTVISWFFETDDYDISFGLFYSEDSKKAKLKDGHEEIQPVSRVNSHLVPEDGTYTCKKPGVYILRFDNSFSWVTNKNVHYTLEVIEPSDDKIFKDAADSVNQVSDTLNSTHL